MKVVNDMVTVIEVPQWRGSGSRTAERLKEGARLLADMVGAERRVRVAVEDDLVITASRVRTALEQTSDGFVVTTGGDCGVELQPIAAARRRYGDRLVVIWFDAHGDLNTPATSPSGAYHGMVLRALTGDGPTGLVAGEPLTSRQIVLAGVRDLDAGEKEFIEGAGVPLLPPGADAEALIEAIESRRKERASTSRTDASIATSGTDASIATSASHAAAAASDDDTVVYVHIDFDVLDPEIFASVGSPAPDGLRPEELLSLVRAVGERFKVVGLGLMEYEPSRKEDQELLSSLVSDLVQACTPKQAGEGAAPPGGQLKARLSREARPPTDHHLTERSHTPVRLKARRFREAGWRRDFPAKPAGDAILPRGRLETRTRRQAGLRSPEPGLESRSVRHQRARSPGRVRWNLNVGGLHSNSAYCDHRRPPHMPGPAARVTGPRNLAHTQVLANVKAHEERVNSRSGGPMYAGVRPADRIPGHGNVGRAEAGPRCTRTSGPPTGPRSTQTLNTPERDCGPRARRAYRESRGTTTLNAPRRGCGPRRHRDGQPDIGARQR
ncbi:arginase family protein [Nonomuraea sp. N2-4H]|uniref:arginase family protein n=1 Tax=Nonomuraea sp. N2-4H TaxID=3128898 RepID=UPI00325090B9